MARMSGTAYALDPKFVARLSNASRVNFWEQFLARSFTHGRTMPAHLPGYVCVMLAPQAKKNSNLTLALRFMRATCHCGATTNVVAVLKSST